MEPQRGGSQARPLCWRRLWWGGWVGVLGKGGLRYSSCVDLMRSDSGVHNALLSWGVPNLLTHTLRCTTTHVGVGGGEQNDLLRACGPSLSAVTSAASTRNRTRTQQENRRLCGFSRKIDICRGEENIFGTSENTAYGKRNGRGGRSHGPGSGFTRTPAWPVPGGSGPPPARTPPSPRPR